MDNNSSKAVVRKVIEQYSSIGCMTSRSMFGGYGVLLNDIMFAWVYNGQLYLRGYMQYLPRYLELNMQPMSINVGVTSKSLQYYSVTDAIWQDRPLLEELIQLSIEGAMQDRDKKMQLKENRLRDLPNITLSIERLLYSVGIVNVEMFQQREPVQLYYELKSEHKDLSMNILFVLAAALKGVHVARLTKKERDVLSEQYQQLLKQAGPNHY